MIGRELHDKRSGFTGKSLKLLKNDPGKDDGSDPDKICGSSNQGRSSENGAGDQSDNRQLCPAWHEGRRHYGHFAVTVILDRTGSHDSGNSASRRHKAGNERFSGKAELAEDTVHDKCDTRHISDILKDRQQQEQYQHLRDKPQHGSDACYDTVLDQSVQDAPLCHMQSGQKRIHRPGNPFPENDIVREIRRPCAEGH